MTLIHSKDLRLQPLRIPIGYNILWNEFFDTLDGGKEIFFEDYPNTSPYELYKNKLFQAEYKHFQILIDLGWAPEHDPKGYFLLSVIRTDDKHWENPLYELRTPSKDEIVDKLNELMADVAAGKIK